jgi:hypothetical protein
MEVAIARSVGSSNDALLAMQLGMDEATYRQLKALETRAIRPEDYDLLGVLDKNVQKKTLDVKRLQLFPTETYRGVENATISHASDDHISAFWYWRAEEDDMESIDEQSMPSREVETCGVCLLDFDDGDQLRTLPCGHRFHRDCIDRWLLEASTTCPVDKRDLLLD